MILSFEIRASLIFLFLAIHANATANSCLQAGNDINIGNRNIITSGSGDINVINQCNQEIKNLTQSLLQENISYSAIREFFKTLQIQGIEKEQYYEKLQEIAKAHVKLKQQLLSLKETAKDDKSVKLLEQAEKLLENGKHSDAENLFEKIYQHQMTTASEYLSKIKRNEKGYRLALSAAVHSKVAKGLAQQSQFKYAEAANSFDLAASTIEKIANHFDDVDSFFWSHYLYLAATNYQAISSFKNAERVLKQRVKLSEHDYKKDKKYAIALSNALNEAGLNYKLSNNLDEAELYYNKALDVLNKNYGKSSSHSSYIVNNLGTLYTEYGDFDNAEKYLLMSIELLEKHKDDNGLSLAITVDNLATLYRNNQMLDKSVKHSNMALSILEENEEEEGKDYAVCLHNLGITKNKMGHFTDAIKFMERSLILSEKILGNGHQLVKNTILSLVESYDGLGKHKYADKLLLRLFDNENNVFNNL